MGITAESGPSVVYGMTQTSTGGITEYNEERGPSLNDLGQGILDPRPPYCYQPGAAVGTKTRGFWNGYSAVDQVPGSVSTNCLAVTQVPSSGTYAVTLVSCSSLNTVVTGGVSLTPPEGGVTVTGLVGIDMGTATSSNVGLQTIAFGSGGSINMWDPRAMSARTIQWTGSSNSSAETLSVAGRDVYGYKMTESIVSTPGSSTNGATTFKGQKAWKYISAVTLVATSGTIGSTALIIGVNDVYGFPMLVQHPAYVTVWWGGSTNAQLITQSSVWHSVGFSSITQTATTPDVRGTFTSSAASNSSGAVTVKLVMFATPSVQNLPLTATSGYTGIFGNTQFSSV